MSGAGKWIKKHPAESIAILATLGTAGMAAPALGAAAAGAGAAGAAGAGAAGTGAALGLGGGTASLFGAGAGAGTAAGLLAPATATAGMGGGTAALFGAEAGMGAGLLAPSAMYASTPTMATIAAETPIAAGSSRFADAEKFLKLAKQANDMGGGDERQQMPGPLQLRGPGQQMQSTPMYGSGFDLEDEKRRQYMEMMARQQGGGFYG